MLFVIKFRCRCRAAEVCDKYVRGLVGSSTTNIDSVLRFLFPLLPAFRYPVLLLLRCNPVVSKTPACWVPYRSICSSCCCSIRG